MITVSAPCYAGLPAWIKKLAATTVFPPPDDPDDPESSFTVSVELARQFEALFNGLIEYIQVQDARCGEATPP